jgi:hypothetical protein
LMVKPFASILNFRKIFNKKLDFMLDISIIIS